MDYIKHKGLESAYSKIISVHGSPTKRAEVEAKYGITYEQIRDLYLQEVSSCPECGQSMAAMGLDFKSPKQSDLEAWTIIRHLYDHGFAFFGCGCSVNYAPPSSMSELPGWLDAHTKKSEGEKLLEAFSAKRI